MTDLERCTDCTIPCEHGCPLADDYEALKAEVESLYMLLKTVAYSEQ